jgi:hypothetical protein
LTKEKTGFFYPSGVLINMDKDIFDELFECERKAREAADAEVTLEQASLKPGDFCVRYVKTGKTSIAIYSEILDAADFILKGRKVEDLDEEERTEYEDVRDSYQEENMKNYRFTKSYSCLCPNGELGDIHISVVERKISQEEFLQARKYNWV